MDINGDKKTFILDKKDGVTKGFTTDEVVEKIPEMPSISSNIRQNISRDYLKYAF